MDTTKIRAIVFDFDGVIVRDSEFLKERVWDKIFGEWPDWNRSVRSTFQKSLKRTVKAGGSRFEILRDFFAALGKSKDEVAALTDEYAAQFDSAVQKGIMQQGVADTDRVALTFLAVRFPLCINSATPEDALGRSVSSLGLSGLFRYVYGRPNDKPKNMRRIAHELCIEVADILFVGDGPGDVAAWMDTGCQFVGITNTYNGWIEKPFPLLSSVAELPAFLSIRV